MSELYLIATTAFGLEAVAARELRELGYNELTVENGKVNFSADPEAICRTNLWLRSADRVLLRLGEFRATTFDELFEGTRALAWPDWIPVDGAFPVTGKSINSKLFSVPDCQAIVKKAIVEKMKSRYGKSWFEESGTRFKVEVALLKDMATLTIDTSGAGLHKRGYRKLGSEAPLKETLAASLVLLSRWRGERALIDPFCGSGTIPVEAAMIGLDMAPGFYRDFDAEKWPALPGLLWRRAREEAADRKKRDVRLNVQGSDIDGDVLSLARYHAGQAGVGDSVSFQARPLAELRSRYKYGFIISNPPYGHRLGDTAGVERLYREMGRVFGQLDTWSFYIITAHPDFERLLKRRADKKRKLYNGRIQCDFYQYYGPRPPRREAPPAKEGDTPPLLEKRSQGVGGMSQ